MKIIVTGGSGFIGTNLVEYHLSRGDEVCNIDIAPPRNKDHANCWQYVDLLNAKKLESRIREFAPTVIFHMAARTDLDGACVADYPANTIGVENLISSIEGLTSLNRVIFASSRLVCRIGYQPSGDEDYCPTTAYGESKVLGEQLVRKSATRIPCSWIIVRPTSIWGPWFDIPYKTFFLTIAKRRYFHPGKCHVLKSFGFVGNTIFQLQSLTHADASAISGRTTYLADYPPIDVAEMANTIQLTLGSPPIKSVSIRLLRLAALAGDALKICGWHAPPLTSFRLQNLLTPMVHDLEFLRATVGALPYSMQQGVERTVGWLKQQGQV
jgi:nucleoside-diphosphate-sugar epimerase